MGLLPAWKKIGEVPRETAAAVLPVTDESSAVVAHGTVKTVYAPVGREEAVVSVEITLPARKPMSPRHLPIRCMPGRADHIERKNP
jgi:hypothetical protein